MHRALLLAALVILPGCIVQQDTARDVTGKAEGYYPTGAFLKVQIKTEDGYTTLADFNRTEWYVAEIARRIDERSLTHMSAHGQLRLIGEVLVENVTLPDLDALRYDTMKATAAQRHAMDNEYEALLQRVGAPELTTPDAVAPPAVPTLAAPTTG